MSAAVDWEAAEMVAARLGWMARKRVADRDAVVVRDWCVQMAGAHTGEGNALRSMTYLELAVIAGYRPREGTGLVGREWKELLQVAQRLASACALKVKEEEAAKAAAGEKERAAKAKAGAAKGLEDPRLLATPPLLAKRGEVQS
jgi:hypothetical protein